MNINRSQYDVLVVGTGISGLAAAAAAAGRGLSVLVVSKENKLATTNTWYAQGGIVARGEQDSADLLAKDIVRAGDGINHLKAVRLLAEEGPAAVYEYLCGTVKVPFQKKGQQYDYTKEAAHSLRRILHVRDETGKAVEEHLLSAVSANPNITLLPNRAAVDLISTSHNSSDPEDVYKPTRVIGAYVLDTKSEVVSIVFASSTILAAGGIGNLYLHTSNPAGATGDGIAMAFRAGAQIINAEYTQFHPTVLYHRDIKRFLISESLRGEGARLKNRRGEFFMDRYQPQLKDLAPRDEVARAIYYEMEQEDSAFVYLDTPGMSGIDLPSRFPKIYQKCREAGIDISHDAVPVVPAAHYFCGGIKVDPDGRSTIGGLYAVGECACTGVHGANRLASVSLLEGLYFGQRAGRFVCRHEKGVSQKTAGKIPDWVYPDKEEEFDPVLIYHDLYNIQTTMWNYAGIVRTHKRLDRAISDLNYLSHRIEKFYKQAKITKEILELRNAVISASLISAAARSNPVSRGCHYIKS